MALKWIPAQTKFKKPYQQKIQQIDFFKSSTSLIFGQFGLQVLKENRLTSKQLEATRRMISKYVRKKEILWIRCIPNTPVTSKPVQIRMGKGKGDVDYWVYRLLTGKILLEVGNMSSIKAKKILIPAAKKLGVSCRIVRRRLLYRTI